MWKRRHWPVCVLGERIRGQRDQRRSFGVKTRPVDCRADGPRRQQRVASCRRQVIVGRQGRRIVGSDAALPADVHAGRKRVAMRVTPQCFDRIRQPGRGERQPVLHRLPAQLQGRCDGGQVGIGETALRQRDREPLRVFRQSVSATRGQHQQRRRRRCVRSRAHRDRNRLWNRRLAHDEERVGAPGSERRDRGHARNRRTIGSIRPLPGFDVVLQKKGRTHHIDVRVDVRAVESRHAFTVLELQQHLGQTGDAGRRLEMTDVRLDRAQRAERLVRRAGCERLRQPFDFDGIAHIGARAVRFDVADVAGIDPGARERIADEIALRTGIGHCVSVRAAAVVDARRQDHAMDRVAVVLCLGQAFEQHHADAFSGHEAGRVGAETAAASIGGQHALRTQADIRGRMQVQIHAAGQGKLALVAQQVLAGFVDGGQRRRTHRVDREAGTVEIEQIGNAIGHRSEAGVGRRRIAALGQIAAMQFESGLGDAGEYADPSAVPTRQAVAGVVAVFQRFPTGLQEQSLLRIHVQRFGRRKTEEQRIEFGESVEEPAPSAVAHPARDRCRRVFAEEAVQRPALCRNGVDAIATGAQIAPEFIEIARMRIAAGEPDDGDGFARVCAAHARLRHSSDGSITLGSRSVVARRHFARRAGFDIERAPSAARLGVLRKQMVADRHQRRELIEQGFRQTGKRGCQTLVELHDHDRVDVECFQRRFAVDPRHVDPGYVAEDGGETLQRALGDLRRFDTGAFIDRGAGRQGVRSVHARVEVHQQIADVSALTRQHGDAGFAAAPGAMQRGQTVFGVQWGEPCLAQFRFRLRREPHAALAPVRPIDTERPAPTQATRSLRAASFGESAHERVGSGVVALPCAAGDAADGAETEQEIERRRVVAGIQVFEAGHLRRQHALQSRCVLACEIAVVQHAGRVHDAVDAAVLRRDRLQQRSHLRAIGDIRAAVFHLQAIRTQRHQVFVQVGSEFAATDQHDGARSQCRRHFARDDHAEPTAAAGDEIAAAISPGRSRRCTDMFRVVQWNESAHARRRPDVAHVSRREGRRAEDPLDGGLGRDVRGQLERLHFESVVFAFAAEQQCRQRAADAPVFVAGQYELQHRGRHRCRFPHQFEQCGRVRCETLAHARTAARKYARPGIGICGRIRRESLHERRVGREIAQDDEAPMFPTQTRGRQAIPAFDEQCRWLPALRRRIGCHGRRIEPEPLLAEGIGRRADPARNAGRVKRAPIEREAVDPQRRQFFEVALTGPARERAFKFGARGIVGSAAEDLRRMAAIHAGRRFAAVQPTLQSRLQFVRVRSDDGQSMRHFPAAQLQGVGEAVQGRRRAPRCERRQLRRQRPQAFGIVRGQRKQPRAGRAIVLAFPDHAFFEDDMRIAAAYTHRTHRRAVRPRALPRSRRVDDEERRLIEFKRRVGRFEMQGRRNPAARQTQGDLDAARQPGGRVEVPDVGLDRADAAEPARIGMPAVRLR